MQHEVIILGAGPAGLSTALWCADLGIAAVVFERHAEVGGQLLWVNNPVHNHLGVRAANGRELRDLFVAHASAFRLDIRTASLIGSVELASKSVALENGEVHRARFIVIATGLRRRQLGIPGEHEFEGRGVFASATADLESFRGKRVCIVGGGDGAVENALMLAAVGAHVTIVHRRSTLSARRQFLERLRREGARIQLITEAEPRRIYGNEVVAGLEIERHGKREAVETDAVLIRIGFEPNSELFRAALDTDARGYIRVNRELETSIGDVFAVGDISNPLAPTVSSAVGDGATAAKVIASRIRA